VGLSLALSTGMGMYSKMGFSYGGDAGGTGGVSSDSDSSDSDSEEEEDGGAEAPQSAEEVGHPCILRMPLLICCCHCCPHVPHHDSL
jgi:hypothetical protein